jgi:hypothetical protein
MSQPVNQPTWWELHLRKARGEPLSQQDQQQYDAEIARQDQEAPPLKSDLETLKKMREEVLALARDNTSLRSRLAALDKEIQLIENSLSRETRKALGVGG